MKKLIALFLTLMLVFSVAAIAQADEEVTISLWHRWSGTNEKILQECVDKFMADNPGIKIDVVAKAGEYFELLQSMISDAAAGNAKPDIFVGGYNLLNYIAEELDPTDVADLAPDAAAVTELYGRFTDEMLALAKWDGKQIGLPLAVSNMVMYVNMDIFRAAGLTEADIPTTWEEARKVCATIKEKCPDKYGLYLQLPDTWGDQAIIFSAGGEMLNADKTRVDFTNEGLLYALQTWQDFYTEGYIPHCLDSEATPMFNSGDIAMNLTTIMKINTYKEQSTFDLRVAQTLGFDGKVKQLPAGGAAMISFSTTDAKKAAVFKFMQFMTSKEGMEMFTKTGYLCITKDEVPMVEGQEYAYAQTQYARPWECWPGGSAGLEIDGRWLSVRNSIVMEGWNVKESLAALEEECNMLLDNQ